MAIICWFDIKNLRNLLRHLKLIFDQKLDAEHDAECYGTIITASSFFTNNIVLVFFVFFCFLKTRFVQSAAHDHKLGSPAEAVHVVDTFS